MSQIHRVAGFLVVGVFTVGWVWGAGAAIARRDPGRHFWTWLTAQQVIAVIQALIGSFLWVAGLRSTTWLHYVYGYGPLVIFLLGHAMAREMQRAQQEERLIQPWAVFALASFICFGLATRALMTGLNLG